MGRLKKSALKQKLVQSFTKSFIITFEFDNAYFALVEVLLTLYDDMKKKKSEKWSLKK